MLDNDPKLDISTFLISSIHDMKNSLGVMTAYLGDVLATADASRGMAREKIAQALYEAQRVSDHLVQLLALYKIEQAFYPFDPQDYALADLSREAMARISELAALRGIELECDCPEELYGWLDHELVFGVLVQALHNALRYTRHRVRLSIRPGTAGVTLLVQDDGHGYPEFLLNQGNGHRQGISFDTGSTGLGLYFAQVVARMHKSGGHAGSVRLNNGGDLGGACFQLDLP